MARLANYIRALFFARRFYILLSSIIVLFLTAYILPELFIFSTFILIIFSIAILIDFLLLFLPGDSILASRRLPARFSNGDENIVDISLYNSYPFPCNLRIIDEIPFQFQNRSFYFDLRLAPKEKKNLQYTLRPVSRGEYHFYSLNLFAKSPFGIIIRRYTIDAAATVKVYPSFHHLRKYELMAFSSELTETGTRRIPKLGHSLEFEQIQEYVSGDDIRLVNWRATARKGSLMVNHFSDERSQQIFCVIDTGRMMKMPFNGMTLVDYAINASLVLSKVALSRSDKAGLISFSKTTDRYVPADRKSGQMERILDQLYHLQSVFSESDYEQLYSFVRQRIPQRSFLILFTNFESMNSMERQQQYLRKMAKKHLVLVIFFQNSSLVDLAEQEAKDIESLYEKTISEKFLLEKKLMIKLLNQYGIHTLYTKPGELSIHSVNKYLELKARQAI